MWPSASRRITAMDRSVHGRRTRVGHEAAEGFLREAKLAGTPPHRVRRAGFGTDLPLSRPVRGGSANICARRYVFIIRAGRPPSAACTELTLGSRQGQSRHGRLARRRCDRRRGSIRGSVDRGARFRSTRRRSQSPILFRAAHEMVRGDGEATTGAGNVLLDVAEKNGLGLYENLARMFLDWTRPGSASPTGWRDSEITARRPSTRALGSLRRCFTVGSRNSKPSRCPWTRR